MNRYQQQLLLPEIGSAGQEKLSNASVVIVGAGGLGTVVASYLTAMGVGQIGICDFDLIEQTNLHRQYFYTPDDIGLKKSEVLSKKMRLQNPGIDIAAIAERLNSGNLASLSGYQVICDCTDNAEARVLLNEYCRKSNKTLVHGAVSDWQGYLTVFYYKKKYGLTDLFQTEDYGMYQSCAINGINSALCGIVGSYMVNETIKVLLEMDEVLEGKLLYINGLNNRIKILKFNRTT